MKTLADRHIQKISHIMFEMANSSHQRGHFQPEVARVRWIHLLKDILHEENWCPCQHGKTCVLQMPPQEQDVLLSDEHALSFSSFLEIYKSVCIQALDNSEETT